ncbi:leucine-rich repeat receptor-like kinase [Striga asiatica]|uniref:Leucine-rich repeat receptor-like kinase n=1 Tax=Striga asiatica TaxID=4170 RepID=A0A5A7QV68_STRAF|nr:leucine-rich repeat receptor-like kinase [Striga asiatica]
MIRVGVLSLVVLCFISSLRVINATEEDEAAALLAFKNNLHDPTNTLKSWNTDNGLPCSLLVALWLHISCNSKQVIRIDLGGQKLKGKLVPDLGKLTALQSLYVILNKVSMFEYWIWIQENIYIAISLQQAREFRLKIQTHEMRVHHFY